MPTWALVAHVADVFSRGLRATRHARTRQPPGWRSPAGARRCPCMRDSPALALGGVVSRGSPTDERCVPHDHPACNLRALRDGLRRRCLAMSPTHSPARMAMSMRRSRKHVRCSH
jgi:hypothetical protein